MTTTVTIDAHLSSEKEVKVTIVDEGENLEEFSLQDGDSEQRHVYDGREIRIKEVAK